MTDRISSSSAPPRPSTPDSSTLALPVLDSVAAFLRAATPGSTWRCVNVNAPRASGLRTITGGKRSLRYSGTRADGSTFNNGRMDPPKRDKVRFDGHRVHFLHEPGSDRVAYTWIWESGSPDAPA